MAELGFFAQELNIGWEEWHEAHLPTHSGYIGPGEIRCSCWEPVATSEELRT